jgi:hypothetical protein
MLYFATVLLYTIINFKCNIFELNCRLNILISAGLGISPPRIRLRVWRIYFQVPNRFLESNLFIILELPINIETWYMALVLTSVKILINAKFDNKCILKFCFLKVNYPIDAVVYLAHLFCDTLHNLKEASYKTLSFYNNCMQ